MPEPERHLREMLEQLHAELQRTSALDDRSRELLRGALNDIEDLLARAGAPGQRSESITERLREAVGAFEETHPTLTGAIGRVAEALSAIGL